MTAASDILHEAFHSPAFTRKGGKREMVQLWVNLPAKDNQPHALSARPAHGAGARRASGR